ncbi:MAG: hypothetical protein PHW22_01165 [Bacilli bacterium]|nr:hypothetical protein [Bacilli bacterium]
MTNKLDLFLGFGIQNKKWRIDNEEIEKRGLPVKDEFDFQIIRYIASLRDRINNLILLKNEIEVINKEAIEETEKLYETNYGMSYKRNLLANYYETFLNQIYGIMENVAKINFFVFENHFIHNKQLIQSFQGQRKKIIEGKLSLHPDYDNIIKNDLDWYNELSAIRHTFIHFIAGMCVIDRKEEIVLKYLTFNLSVIELNKEEKIIRNIIEDIESFYNKTMTFLNDISTIYLKNINPRSMHYDYVLKDDYLEIMEISLGDYLEGKKGKFVQKVPINKTSS